MISDIEGFASPTQASFLMGFSPSRVHQLVSEGKLDAVNTPLGKLISLKSIERFLEERKTNPPKSGPRGRPGGIRVPLSASGRDDSS